jgi:hypothetical protein
MIRKNMALLALLIMSLLASGCTDKTEYTALPETLEAGSSSYAVRLWLGDFNPSDDYLDFIAEHYQYVIVPESKPDLINALLDRDPKIKLILYTNPVFTQPSMNYPEEYYAHSGQSTNDHKRIINEKYGTYLMDISSTAWRTAVADAAKNAVYKQRYYGVMADDCGPDISQRVDFIPDGYDVSKWRADIKEILSVMNNEIDGLLIFNGIYNRPEYTGRELLEVTDGSVREGFIFHLSSGEFLSEEYWVLLLNYLLEDTQTDYHVANAKLKRPSGKAATVDERMFALTSYKLIMNDHVIYTPEDWGLVTGNNRTLIQYFPEMDIDLGAPLKTGSKLEDYRDPLSNLYKREFENGVVLVNPSMERAAYELDHSAFLVVPVGGGVVNDDGTYGNTKAALYYQVVDQVMVPPQSGVILLVEIPDVPVDNIRR